jgi:hypothetical protein
MEVLLKISRALGGAVSSFLDDAVFFVQDHEKRADAGGVFCEFLRHLARIWMLVSPDALVFLPWDAARRPRH